MLSLHDAKVKAKLLLNDGEAKLHYITAFAEAFSIEQILNDTVLRQNQIQVFGKMHLEPRLTAWYGPPYKYANIQWEDQNMPTPIDALCTQVSAACNFDFNAVLLNYYRDGNDSMGWHRDNEQELDHRIIASLSLGETRIFKIRNRNTKDTLDVALEHGSLLIMENMQVAYEHALPKRRKVHNARLNLTFRRIRS